MSTKLWLDEKQLLLLLNITKFIFKNYVGEDFFSLSLALYEAVTVAAILFEKP